LLAALPYFLPPLFFRPPPFFAAMPDLRCRVVKLGRDGFKSRSSRFYVDGDAPVAAGFSSASICGAFRFA
jgi:hypothetical protein